MCYCIPYHTKNKLLVLEWPTFTDVYSYTVTYNIIIVRNRISCRKVVTGTVSVWSSGSQNDSIATSIRSLGSKTVTSTVSVWSSGSQNDTNTVGVSYTSTG
jgi:hypothetical protein